VELMRPVIVPLDGSRRAETAIPYARAIEAGAPLLLVTTMWGTDAVAPRDYLLRSAAELADTEVDTTVVYDDGPANAILLMARQHPGATICMAAHGRSGLGEAVLGSVAEAVVRDAEHPVLLVGPHVESDPSSPSPVVIAVDNPTTAAAIAPPAAALASTRELEVWAIEVVAPAPVPFSTEVDTMGWPEDGAAAEAALAALARLGFDAESEVLRDVDPARGIVDFARKLPASVVVVGTHARRGLARVALGSVAMNVVHRAPCPVLVLRT
jgi:nucleotide-binding universal stress UspA family protein